MNETELPAIASKLKIGKRLPGAVYLHRSLLLEAPQELGMFVIKIAQALNLTDIDWNVAKIHCDYPRISYLQYQNFDSDPYPQLARSKIVDLQRKSVRDMDFSEDNNPPILHRKELLVSADYPGRSDFEATTREGEDAGLYEDTRRIGFSRQWGAQIASKGYEVVDGRLFRSAALGVNEEVIINREKTAISRTQFSAPMQFLSRNGYLEGQHTVCDYGCGRGDDLAILESLGIDAVGWDPNHRPEGERLPSDIVNLGFVINVIEDRIERDHALRSAYELAHGILVVSAMIASDTHIAKFKPFKDGVITSRRTFQKYYDQSELRQYIESTLGMPTVAAASGVFLVFKDEVLEAEFAFSRYQRRTKARERNHVHRKSKAELLRERVDAHMEICDAYWLKSLARGRWASAQESEHADQLITAFGSLKKAQRAILEVFDEEELNLAEKVRENEIIFSQAMSFFQGRSAFSKLPDELQRDIRYFYGTYRELQEKARELLASLVDTEIIELSCIEFHNSRLASYFESSKALTLSTQVVIALPLPLRTYVGCAEQLVGGVDQFDLVKIHVHTGKVSFMKYDGFASEPIPSLVERVKVDLWNQRVHYFDYVDEYAPKPLFWKSLFMLADEPDYKKQTSFDKKLDELGLAPENPHFGYSVAEVLDVLRHKGLEIRGHRFYKT